MSEKKLFKFRKEKPDPKAETVKADVIQKKETGEPQPEAKPRDVSAEISTLIQAYKGDLYKVQEFIIENFDKREIFDSGYQICLIQSNERLARENALRDIVDNVLRGKVSLPFDPRDDPVLIKLIQKVIPAQVVQAVPRESQRIPAPVKVPDEIPIVPVHEGSFTKPSRNDEDFTSSEEERLAEIHKLIDTGD